MSTHRYVRTLREDGRAAPAPTLAALRCPARRPRPMAQPPGAPGGAALPPRTARGATSTSTAPRPAANPAAPPRPASRTHIPRFFFHFFPAHLLAAAVPRGGADAEELQVERGGAQPARGAVRQRGADVPFELPVRREPGRDGRRRRRRPRQPQAPAAGARAVAGDDPAELRDVHLHGAVGPRAAGRAGQRGRGRRRFGAGDGAVAGAAGGGDEAPHADHGGGGGGFGAEPDADRVGPRGRVPQGRAVARRAGRRARRPAERGRAARRAGPAADAPSLQGGPGADGRRGGQAARRARRVRPEPGAHAAARRGQPAAARARLPAVGRPHARAPARARRGGRHGPLRRRVGHREGAGVRDCAASVRLLNRSSPMHYSHHLATAELPLLLVLLLLLPHCYFYCRTPLSNLSPTASDTRARRPLGCWPTCCGRSARRSTPRAWPSSWR